MSRVIAALQASSGNEISIISEEYQAALVAMNIGIQNLSPSVSEVMGISEQAPTMYQYRERLNQISFVLTQLQNLLQRDHYNLQNIERKFISADTKISTTFKSAEVKLNSLSGGR